MKKFLVLIISIIFSMIFISGGYGYWQKKIIISGSIDVVKPPMPAVISGVPASSSKVENKTVAESQIDVNEKVKKDENTGNEATVGADSSESSPAQDNNENISSPENSLDSQAEETSLDNSQDINIQNANSAGEITNNSDSSSQLSEEKTN